MNRKNDDDQGVDIRSFTEYLQTDKGHELASRVVGIVEDLKKLGLEKSVAHATSEKRLRALIIAVVVIAASVLSYFGKFETSIGVLFGTLVGYLFGRR